MLARICTATVEGITPIPIETEVDIGKGLPGMTLLGLSDQGARESRDRVRAALRNTGFDSPFHKVTINLAPVSVRKEGAFFDLAIALGLLEASDQLGEPARQRLSELLVVGELGLDGALRPVRGALALAIGAREAGCKGILLPQPNAREAAWVRGLSVFGVRSLTEAAEFLSGERAIEPTEPVEVAEPHGAAFDLAEVRGQAQAKLALVLAAAGGHNLLLVGPPGAGKTMLAKCLPGLLPALPEDEALEVTRIQSVAGLLRGGLRRTPPFRAPHHTSTEAALIGGGRPVRPGEVTLAHRGVLFLDELPEFGARKLDTLRQPLEDRLVRIGRATGTFEFPAQFMCVAAMNPCPCGTWSPEVPCRCSPLLIERYAGRVSGPLRDRFDLSLWLKALPVRELALSEDAPPDPGEWTSDRQRERIERARAAQRARQGSLNAELRGRALARHARLGRDETELLAQSAEHHGLSARQVQRVRRVARTAADLDGALRIRREHVLIALMQRELRGVER